MDENHLYLTQLAKSIRTIPSPPFSIHTEKVVALVKNIRNVLFTAETVEESVNVLIDIQRELTEIFYVSGVSEAKSEVLSRDFLQKLPEIKRLLLLDLKKTFQEDPSATDEREILLSYPGIFATGVYRISHEIFKLGFRTIARIMSEYAHRLTGIDIHPGATVGHSFFIDHGTGVVIGETCHIGNNVSIYHGVTLGILSFERNDDGEIIKGIKRHPTIEDDVVIYAEAMILGGDTIVGKGSVIGSHVTIVKSVPSYSKIIHRRND